MTGKPYKMHFLAYFYTLIKLNIMCKVADHESHVRWIYLTTVPCVGEGQKYVRKWNVIHFVRLTLDELVWTVWTVLGNQINKL